MASEIIDAHDTTLNNTGTNSHHTGEHDAFQTTRPTPIHMLSFDIIYTIFKISYDMLGTGETFAIVASHVCRSWRSLAINSAALWTSISFVHSEPRWEKHKTWLSRSQEAPLTILMSDAAFKRSSLKKLSRFLHLILPHAARWLSLSIEYVPTKVLRVFFERVRTEKVPTLRTVNVQLDLVDRHPWKVLSFLHGTPSLHQLSLKYTPFNYSSSFFDNLSELVIDHSQEGIFPTYHHAISLIRTLLIRSPHLHTLRFGLYVSEIAALSDVVHRQPVHSTTIVHHGLRILSFYPDLDLLEPFLHEIQTPSLHSILWYENMYCQTSITLLPIFAQWPTPCNLAQATFVIYAPPASASANEIAAFALPYLPAALAVLSALEQLEFKQVDFGGQGRLECLGRLCPRLRDLKLDYCRGVSPEEMHKAVDQRIETDGVEPLKVLTITYHQFMTGRQVSKAAMSSLGYQVVSSGFREIYLLDEN